MTTKQILYISRTVSHIYSKMITINPDSLPTYLQNKAYRVLFAAVIAEEADYQTDRHKPKIIRILFSVPQLKFRLLSMCFFRNVCKSFSNIYQEFFPFFGNSIYHKRNYLIKQLLENFMKHNLISFLCLSRNP